MTPAISSKVTACPRIAAPFRFHASWWDGEREQTHTSPDYDTFGGAFRAAQRWLEDSGAPWREVGSMKAFRMFTHVDGTLRVHGTTA